MIEFSRQPNDLLPKILHVFSTFKVGGPQVRFCDLVDGMAGLFTHHVIAMDGAYDCAQRINPSLDISYGPPPKQQSFVRRLLEFRQLLKQLQPDLLITYNWGAIEWALANIVRCCPHVHMEDGFGREEAEQQLARRVWFRRLVLTQHSTIVVPSRTLHELARTIWRLPERRIRYIPNGIDTARFKTDYPPVLHQRLGLSPKTAIIGTVARLQPEKNLIRLIDAFALAASHEKMHLVIVGDGSERANLEAHVASQGLNNAVTFLGHDDTPELLLTSFAVYGLSSDTEQMPYGVIEAMASGLPIAGVDVGDTKHIVSEQNRSYIRDVNSGSLAQSISMLATRPELAKEIGLSNRHKAEKIFSIEEMISKYRDLFGTCLAHNSRSFI